MGKSYGTVDYDASRVATVIISASPRQFAAYCASRGADLSIEAMPSRRLSVSFATSGAIIASPYGHLIAHHLLRGWALHVLAETLTRGTGSIEESAVLLACGAEVTRNV